MYLSMTTVRQSIIIFVIKQGGMVMNKTIILTSKMVDGINEYLLESSRLADEKDKACDRDPSILNWSLYSRLNGLCSGFIKALDAIGLKVEFDESVGAWQLQRQ